MSRSDPGQAGGIISISSVGYQLDLTLDALMKKLQKKNEEKNV